ncbi:hypothetical protein D3C86_1761400 [compost metagenome]
MPDTFKPAKAKHMAMRWSAWVSISAAQRVPAKPGSAATSRSSPSTVASPGRMALRPSYKAWTRSHSLTRRLASSVKRTGVWLKAANTARVGIASCICEPLISAGMCGNCLITSLALASGWVKSASATPRSMAPPVRACAAQR